MAKAKVKYFINCCFFHKMSSVNETLFKRNKSINLNLKILNTPDVESCTVASLHCHLLADYEND